MKENTSPSPPSADPCSDDIARGIAALDRVVAAGQRSVFADELCRELGRKRRQRRFVATVAAACAALALFVGPDWSGSPARSVVAIAPLASHASSSQTLPDGSRVELDRFGRIDVQFSADGAGERRVVLEAGEAHFEVAKDPARPFVVVAGSVAVRAVGTAFAVQLQPGGVDVLVTEGRVAVESTADRKNAEQRLATLDAGQRVLVSAGPQPHSLAAVETLAPAEQASRLAWRVPRLEFSGLPLAEVIVPFNRHGPLRLELADPSLATLQISGALRADNTAALLKLLEIEFGLVADIDGASARLRRK